MRRIEGVVVAVVKDLDDPQGEGRIKVAFPWLEGEPQSTWAPVARPFAGPDRGAWWMPELEDECLVAFDHGDFDHPYVVGFLWNGSDKPPNADINTSVRRLRTVSGHELDFDDNGGNERVVLTTANGHEIELKDNPVPGTVTVKTNGGHELVMTDGPAASVRLESTGGQQIVLNDVPPGIEISTGTIRIAADATGLRINVPAGMVTLNCLQASVNATALLNVNAPVAQFAGVVIASSVVASAYTPAPGNTFGL